MGGWVVLNTNSGVDGVSGFEYKQRGGWGEWF